jgi:hypothetical protein
MVDSEDIPDHARSFETVEARLWRCLKAFDNTIDIASKTTLKPKKNPDLRGVKWWNNEYMAAHTLVYHAPTGAAHQQAFRELHHTIKWAKHTWGHNVLNGADSTTYIWRMAKVHKGQVNNIFLALRWDDGSLAKNLQEKLDLL